MRTKIYYLLYVVNGYEFPVYWTQIDFHVCKMNTYRPNYFDVMNEDDGRLSLFTQESTTKVQDEGTKLTN